MNTIPLDHIVAAAIFLSLALVVVYRAGLKFNSAMIAATTVLSLYLESTAYSSAAPYVFGIGFLTYILCLVTILRKKLAPWVIQEAPKKEAL